MTLFKLALVAFIYSISTISIASNVDGKLSTYYDSGSKMADKIYKDGVPIGTWRSWYENGNTQSATKFLDDTGQIEILFVWYKNGVLMYSGAAYVSNRKGEESSIMSSSKCIAKSIKKDDGGKWYNKYELKYVTYYEDGRCIEPSTQNIDKLYLRLTDETTGNIYDFPWNQLWGTVPKFLREKESDSK